MYLALKAGGLSNIRLQHLILTLRNRIIHKCDLSNVCNALDINIELFHLDDVGDSRVGHYPAPYIDVQSNHI